MKKILLALFLAALAMAGAPAQDEPPNFNSGPVTDPAQVAQHYRQVVSEPKFQETREPDAEASMRDWLTRWFERLGSGFGELENAPEMPRFASMLMTLFVLLSLTGLIYSIVRLVRRRGGWKEDGVEKTAEKTALRSPEFYEAELAEATAAGNWRRAWLACWRQFLSRLERGELVIADRSRTNREYLVELRRQPLPGEVAPLLSRLVDAYDQFIYGRRAIDEPEWQSFRRQVDEATLLLGLLNRPTTFSAKGAAP